MFEGRQEQLPKVSVWRDFLNRLDFPENMPDYGSQAYWEARYEMEDKEQNDWYVDYDVLRPYFLELLDPHMEIMELGCGNSNILGSLYKNGFKNLTGTDFSWNVINARKNDERYLKRGIKWEILDITKEWPSKKIDCIFEKAVLDCLPAQTIEKSLKLIYQSLNRRGIFLHVSNSRPERRIKLLEGNW